MEMHASNHELSMSQTESGNNTISSNESNSKREGLERISQALWKVIHAQAEEDDASLWRMWR